jgi:hypothetical protein
MAKKKDDKPKEAKPDIKKFRNIWGTKINVNAKPRENNEVFEEDANRQEMQNLVRCKYVEEVQ